MSDGLKLTLASPEAEAWFETVRPLEHRFKFQATFAAALISGKCDPQDFVDFAVSPRSSSSSPGCFNLCLLRKRISS